MLRRLRKTEAHLWEYQLEGIADRHPDEMLGRAFQNTQETFARLERRRDSVQRAYHRTLHDLRQIQDSRWGALGAQPDAPAAAPPPPEAPKPSAPSPAEPRVAPPATPSLQKPKSENGFVPEYPRTFDPANPVPSPNHPLSAPPSDGSVTIANRGDSLV